MGAIPEGQHTVVRRITIGYRRAVAFAPSNLFTCGNKRARQPFSAQGANVMKLASSISVAFAVALGLAALLAAEAQAVSSGVRSACASDFLAYCRQHDPDSQGARKCMRVNGPSLSKTCLDALIAAGEVSREEVARRDRRK
jgi:hypothetical protein